MLACLHDQLRLRVVVCVLPGDDHYHVVSFLRCLLRRFTFFPPGVSTRTCVSAIALVVYAPAAASTAVARTCTPVDVMLDVDYVCTLTSRLVAAHLVASLEALTAVAVARLPTFGVSTWHR